MLGIGINLTKVPVIDSFITQLIEEFKNRVIADGGTFEAQSCLITFIQELS